MMPLCVKVRECQKEPCAPSRAPPHPAFGHLLPRGEKEDVENSASSTIAIAARVYRICNKDCVVTVSSLARRGSDDSLFVDGERDVQQTAQTVSLGRGLS